MNCPNCNEKPLGILPSFSLNGVSLKEKFRGYFRCKNCGKLLKQQIKSTKLLKNIPVYSGPYKTIFALFMMGFLGTAWGIYYLIEMNLNNANHWILIPVIVVIWFVFMVASSWFETKYQVIEEVYSIEEIPKPEKISIPGVLLFIGYLVIVIVGFLYLDASIDSSKYGPALYSTGAILYVAVSIAGAIILINKLSDTKPDSASG